MPDVFDLDFLDNGEPGALARMTGELAAAGLPFEVIGTYLENEIADIHGTIRNLDEHREAIEAPSEWVEGCLLLPETNLSGRHGLPYLTSRDMFLLGDGLNKPSERYGTSEQPGTASPARPPHVLGAAGRARGTRQVENYRKLERPDTSGATRLDRAFVIGGRGAATYGHWLLDFVPQLLTAQKTADRQGIEAPIVVINITPFAKRLLRFMGLAENCIFPVRDEMLQIGQVYFPLITKLRRRYCISTLRQSYAHLLDLSAGAGKAAARMGHDKLLIARRKPPFCSNFDALREKLEPKGFTVLYPEQFHYKKQYQIFHNATVVVGEDGSAMHNAGFCRPGTPFIVFSRADKVNWWHGPVSQAAGLPLRYLQSRMHDDGTHYDAPIEEILNLV